jgi:hypothetical protein
MRMLNADNDQGVSNVQVYLSPAEARRLMEELRKVLSDAEANEHFHLFSDDGEAEISCSIVTKKKLAKPSYTAEELRAFGNWKPKP